MELATLYNETGQCEKAIDLLESRRFHSWEGGEGLVSEQYVNAHLLLGRRMLESGDATEALTHFEAVFSYPHNLGEGKHLLTPENHLHYFIGESLRRLGREEEAVRAWRLALQPVGANPKFYRALALRRLGSDAEAESLLRELMAAVEEQMKAVARVGYFATSLPNLLLFHDDLGKRNRTAALLILALAFLGFADLGSALADLCEVLTLNPNHLGALEEQRRVEEGSRASASSYGYGKCFY